jgi:hypothetical protein
MFCGDFGFKIKKDERKTVVAESMVRTGEMKKTTRCVV